MGGLRRAWVNQPSTQQPFHNLHGTNVLAEDDTDLMARVWLLSGPVVSQQVPKSALSDGWRDGRPITVHRVGTHEAGHVMPARSMRDYLIAVIDAHEPTEQLPEARVEFPAGFWVDLTTSPGVEAPRP